MENILSKMITSVNSILGSVLDKRIKLSNTLLDCFCHCIDWMVQKQDISGQLVVQSSLTLIVSVYDYFDQILIKQLHLASNSDWALQLGYSPDQIKSSNPNPLWLAFNSQSISDELKYLCRFFVNLFKFKSQVSLVHKPPIRL